MTGTPKPATAECAGCHYIFPKPEMEKFVSNTGRYVDERRTNRYSSDGRLTGYSKSEGYYSKGRDVTTWYCKSCAEDVKRDQVRKLATWTISAVILATGCLVWAAWGPDRQLEPDVETQNGSDNEGTSPKSPLMENGNETLPSETVAPSPSDTVIGDQTSEDVQMSTELDDAGAATTDSKQIFRHLTPTPETSRELRKSMDIAFEKGETRRWKDGALSGYVVVSSPEETTKCRNIYYTVDTKGQEFISNTEKRCP